MVQGASKMLHGPSDWPACFHWRSCVGGPVLAACARIGLGRGTASAYASARDTSSPQLRPLCSTAMLSCGLNVAFASLCALRHSIMLAASAFGMFRARAWPLIHSSLQLCNHLKSTSSPWSVIAVKLCSSLGRLPLHSSFGRRCVQADGYALFPACISH